jgi:predicted RNA-binding Zn-ribbon protein involved in translation (DUF1610 family)
MNRTHVTDEEGPFEISCPCCGTKAFWRYIDEAKTLGAVDCPDCGSFEMPRAEFERIEAGVPA